MEKITPKEFKEIIRGLNTFDNPPAVMIFGEPGIGKSYAAKEIAEELGRRYMPLSLGRLEAYDIKGMPDLSAEFMKWKPPALWREIIENDGNVLLHFDEFTLADEAVQGAVLDIIQMKKIDDIHLPEKTMITVSGNMGGDDGTFAKVITSALTGGRALVFRMKKPSVKEWIEYQKPCSVLEKFLSVNPIHLYRGPNAAEPFSPWSCPRSWSLFDSVIKKLELEKKEKKTELIRYAKSMLSEESVTVFMDYIDNTIIEAVKVLDGDEASLIKFLEADSFRQAALVKEVARMDMKERNKREKLQFFTGILAEKIGSNELLALFAEELVKTDPQTLVQLKVKGIAMDKWADKLAYDL